MHGGGWVVGINTEKREARYKNNGCAHSDFSWVHNLAKHLFYSFPVLPGVISFWEGKEVHRRGWYEESRGNADCQGNCKDRGKMGDLLSSTVGYLGYNHPVDAASVHQADSDSWHGDPELGDKDVQLPSMCDTAHGCPNVNTPIQTWTKYTHLCL